jgi:histone deacetylase complex regulatory component SIN3
MPNLCPWIKQLNSNKNEEESLKPSKFENDLLSIRDERQRMIYPNCHPTYNERHQEIIELINWTLEKYKANMQNTQLNEEQVIIDDIIKQLDKKRDIVIHKKKQVILKNEVSMYKLEETTLDYVLFKIRELTGSKLV